MSKMTKAQARKRLTESIKKIQMVSLADVGLSNAHQQELYKMWLRLSNIKEKWK